MKNFAVSCLVRIVAILAGIQVLCWPFGVEEDVQKILVRYPVGVVIAIVLYCVGYYIVVDAVRWKAEMRYKQKRSKVPKRPKHMKNRNR